MLLLDEGCEPAASRGAPFGRRGTYRALAQPAAKMCLRAARHNPARCDDDRPRDLGTRQCPRRDNACTLGRARETPSRLDEPNRVMVTRRTVRLPAQVIGGACEACSIVRRQCRQHPPSRHCDRAGFKSKETQNAQTGASRRRRRTQKGASRTQTAIAPGPLKEGNHLGTLRTARGSSPSKMARCERSSILTRSRCVLLRRPRQRAVRAICVSLLLSST